MCLFLCFIFGLFELLYKPIFFLIVKNVNKKQKNVFLFYLEHQDRPYTQRRQEILEIQGKQVSQIRHGIQERESQLSLNDYPKNGQSTYLDIMTRRNPTTCEIRMLRKKDRNEYPNVVLRTTNDQKLIGYPASKNK